jgi:putative oxidoreductase
MNLSSLYAKYSAIADCAQAPLLLIVRLYWGGQFIQTGWGKLAHLGKIAEYFASLHIPFPLVNATLAGGTEFLGGIALVLGLGARVAALPLLFTMGVAYATAEHDALAAIFTDPDKFTGATPFLFMYTILLVLAFGPGLLSVDHWLGRTSAAK